MFHIVLIDFIDSDKVLLVRFDMTSILIEDDEVEAIFQEGYSGTNSKKLNKAGDGCNQQIKLPIFS